MTGATINSVLAARPNLLPTLADRQTDVHIHFGFSLPLGDWLCALISELRTCRYNVTCLVSKDKIPNRLCGQIPDLVSSNVAMLD